MQLPGQLPSPIPLSSLSDPSWYQALFQKARDIMLIVGADGFLLDANIAAEKAYGYSREELLGQPVHKLRDPASESEGKGTGLGLNIARKIIEENGGKIGLESELGKGTTCWVWLPIATEYQE